MKRQATGLLAVLMILVWLASHGCAPRPAGQSKPESGLQSAYRILWPMLEPLIRQGFEWLLIKARPQAEPTPGAGTLPY